MKLRFKTFMAIAIPIALLLVFAGGYGLYRVGSWMFSGSSAPATVVQASVTPVPYQQLTLSTAEVRQRIDQWLVANADRKGKGKLNDILPSAPFRATVIRFPETDAVKWSNDPTQWSQVKLDLDRDGKDDEKWLLKNGRTYKREVLGSDGKTVQAEYFKN